MKSIKNLVNIHFVSNPTFSFLENYRCIKKYRDILPQTLKGYILNIYPKAQTIYIVLKHPNFQMEFNNNKTLITQLLNILQINILECKKFKQVKFYPTKTPPKKEENLLNNILQRYPERSKANFKANFKAKALHDISLDIKDIIKKEQKDLS
jgi:hypothetical protein